MGHKYMSYSRDPSGLVVRNHRTILVDDTSDYRLKENLSGWPEKCVFWKVMADMSCVGIAPMSERVAKEFTHYSMI
jgi:dissimilatory sulfite reductase (desulfoviridin) alpha/beta subunit